MKKRRKKYDNGDGVKKDGGFKGDRIKDDLDYYDYLQETFPKDSQGNPIYTRGILPSHRDAYQTVNQQTKEYLSSPVYRERLMKTNNFTSEEADYYISNRLNQLEKHDNPNTIREYLGSPPGTEFVPGTMGWSGSPLEGSSARPSQIHMNVPGILDQEYRDAMGGTPTFRDFMGYYMNPLQTPSAVEDIYQHELAHSALGAANSNHFFNEIIPESFLNLTKKEEELLKPDKTKANKNYRKKTHIRKPHEQAADIQGFRNFLRRNLKVDGKSFSPDMEVTEEMLQKIYDRKDLPLQPGRLKERYTLPKLVEILNNYAVNEEPSMQMAENGDDVEKKDFSLQPAIDAVSSIYDSPEYLNRLKAEYKNAHGIDLSDQEALDIANTNIQSVQQGNPNALTFDQYQGPASIPSDALGFKANPSQNVYLSTDPSLNDPYYEAVPGLGTPSGHTAKTSAQSAAEHEVAHRANTGPLSVMTSADGNPLQPELAEYYSTFFTNAPENNPYNPNTNDNFSEYAQLPYEVKSQKKQLELALQDARIWNPSEGPFTQEHIEKLRNQRFNVTGEGLDYMAQGLNLGDVTTDYMSESRYRDENSLYSTDRYDLSPSTQLTRFTDYDEAGSIQEDWRYNFRPFRKDLNDYLLNPENLELPNSQGIQNHMSQYVGRYAADAGEYGRYDDTSFKIKNKALRDEGFTTDPDQFQLDSFRKLQETKPRQAEAMEWVSKNTLTKDNSREWYSKYKLALNGISLLTDIYRTDAREQDERYKFNQRKEQRELEKQYIIDKEEFENKRKPKEENLIKFMNEVAMETGDPNIQMAEDGDEVKSGQIPFPFVDKSPTIENAKKLTDNPFANLPQSYLDKAVELSAQQPDPGVIKSSVPFDPNSQWISSLIPGATPGSEYARSRESFYTNFMGMLAPIPLVEGVQLTKAIRTPGIVDDLILGPGARAISKIKESVTSSTLPEIKLPEGTTPEDAYQTQRIVENSVKKRKDYISSDEYLQKRMANTGETAEEVNDAVLRYLNELDNSTITYQPIDAQGQYTRNNIEMNAPADDPFYMRNRGTESRTLEHEIDHMLSPISKPNPKAPTKYKEDGKTLTKEYKDFLLAGNRPTEGGVTGQGVKHGAYKDYPTLEINPILKEGKYTFNSGTNQYDYLMNPAEQQARHLGAADHLKKYYGWDGTEAGLTDDMLEGFRTDLKPDYFGQTSLHDVRQIYSNLVDGSGNVIGSHIFMPKGKIIKDPKTGDFISGDVAFDNWKKQIRKILPKAWSISGAAVGANKIAGEDNSYQDGDSVKKKLPSAKDMDYDKLYEAIMMSEHNNYLGQMFDDELYSPWIRTQTSPPGGSTAYGPVQIGSGLIKTYLDPYHAKKAGMSQEDIETLQALRAQGLEFSKHGNEKGNIPDYNPVFDYGGSGTFTDRGGYKNVAIKMLTDMVNRRNDGDVYNMLESWRGPTSPNLLKEYIGKIEDYYYNPIEYSIPDPSMDAIRKGMAPMVNQFDSQINEIRKNLNIK